jgi:hypothetical protein
MTTSGIKLATFGFVVQCLNQLHHHGPLLYTVLMDKSFAADKSRVVTHQFPKISSSTCAVFTPVINVL